MTELSISRSVGRAFQVLEHFQTARTPCTVRDLAAALDVPYSSIRVIAMGLRDLGYLAFDAAKGTYFPTEKLLHLGNSVQSSLVHSTGLSDLVHSLGTELNESTALTSRNFIFCNFMVVQNSTQAIAFNVPPGPGLTLTNSVTGRVLLSQMADTEIERILKYTQYWARQVNAPPVAPKDEIERSIERVRADGYLADYDVWLKGVGTIAFPVKSSVITRSPLAVSVSGPAGRIRVNEKTVRRAIERSLALHYSAEAPGAKPTKSPSRLAKKQNGRFEDRTGRSRSSKTVPAVRN